MASKAFVLLCFLALLGQLSGFKLTRRVDLERFSQELEDVKNYIKSLGKSK
ncbi:unnamed protein product [Pocillopora meandrina]|uniref:Uncharacterized protein n=1 Tax=Pocillopora meandrina TaxID=46732 RepID=A0AAU9VU86_9CNID|nr:unnamed protein product [Pocillopora meandrina]